MNSFLSKRVITGCLVPALRRTMATETAHPPAAVPFRKHVGPTLSTPIAYTFFHSPTWTWQYIVTCRTTSHCVVIDPALDFDPLSNTISTTTADGLMGFIAERGLKLTHVLETHAHADHLSASQWIKRRGEQGGGRVEVAIGRRIEEVQETWCERLGVPREEVRGVFDKLWEDDEEFKLGDLTCQVMHLPGHTPDHVGYKFGDYIFCGDSLFLPDVGSARADFPGGSSHSLYASSQRLLSLPPSTRIFSGHDYPGEDREHSCSSTVAEQKAYNKHLKEGTRGDEFERMREERDRGMQEPRLLYQSLQVNIRAGHLPKDGWLRLPLKGTLDI